MQMSFFEDTVKVLEYYLNCINTLTVIKYGGKCLLWWINWNHIKEWIWRRIIHKKPDSLPYEPRKISPPLSIYDLTIGTKKSSLPKEMRVKNHKFPRFEHLRQHLCIRKWFLHFFQFIRFHNWVEGEEWEPLN